MSIYTVMIKALIIAQKLISHIAVRIWIATSVHC